MKKRIIYILLALAALILVYWLYTHSRIEISISNFKSGSAASLNLHSISKSKDGRTDINSPSLKKIVGKDTYEVYLSQNDKNFFTVVKTGSFLKTTRVDAVLSPEKARVFVGNDPSECMEYLFGVLYSFSCEDFYANIEVHNPANANLPTISSNIMDSAVSGNIEGFMQLNSANLALIQSRFSEEKPSEHYIYTVNKGLVLSNPAKLTELNPGKSYSIEPYKSGFLTYDSSFSQILYYEGLGVKPKAIPLKPATKSGLSATALSVNGDSIIALFSSSGDKSEEKNQSVIIVTNGTGSQNYEFEHRYEMATLCGGNDKLCAVGSKGMSVYDISGARPKPLYELEGVTQFRNSKNGFLVVNKTGVLTFNASSRTGFYTYTFADYAFNYIKITEDGYILNLTNNKNNKVAVLVNQNDDDNDKIDKKISSLQKIAEVEFVNIYDKYIYISASLGARVYDSKLGDYTYNPTIKKRVADKINLEINKLGISRETYSISSNAF